MAGELNGTFPMATEIPFVDLMSRQHKVDPFAFYARLRAEAPVHHTFINGVGNVWLVTRYDDVVEVLKDKRFAKDPRNAGRRIREPDQWEIAIMSDNLLRFDDPAHRRVRGLAAKALKRCGVDHVMPRFAELTGQHLDAMASARDADLVRDFAYPLPLAAISDLIGIPEEDQPNMPRWIDEAVAHAGPPDMTILSEFLRYLQRLVERRRGAPQGDLISAMLDAESDGNRLSADEIVATATALLIAGHETAVNLLSSGALTLIQHPDQAARLIKEPELAGTAVEEILRFAAPVEAATERFATEDVDLNGAAIKRSDLVLAVLASANRDAARFEEPDRFDITRTPNPHLAFGSGAHYCMGAAFAQRQAETALPMLLARCPSMSLAVAPEQLPWKEMPILRGLEALAVRLRP